MRCELYNGHGAEEPARPKVDETCPPPKGLPISFGGAPVPFGGHLGTLLPPLQVS